ncbi:hypothetical protein OEZ85_004246 [Tetradesmus obliquus]|uniref:TF-B3 domain-containing protein n=1 Tax=Tetradesmus obliquus TaxID=3088 RepID=A0ABY8UKQ2_TETOB|nr:hypothetical protein OEZ85_004246 [Tetradesmus obliquus]
MDLRNWPDSHALDDVLSICSFDDDDSVEADAGSPAVAQLQRHDERTPVIDAYAFVDDVKASRKASRTRKGSTANKQQQPVPSSAAAVVPVAAPSKPLKWQLKLADRATAAVTLEAHYQLPPHVLFDLLADPSQHERIFDEIVSASAELLEEEGPRRKWRLDYRATWSFWKVGGICENRLWMWTDRDNGTVTFKLREPGFLRRYEGTWTIKPACGTPMSECYAAAAPAGDASLSPSEYSSSSAGSSPASSRSSSPLRGGMRQDEAMGSRGGLRALLAPFGSSSSNENEDADGSSNASGGFLRVTPLASVNFMSQGVPAGAGMAGSSSSSSSSSSSGNAGQPGSPVRLTGAVAAIFRMQEAFQQSISSGVSTLTSFGSSSAAIPNANNSSSSFLGGLGDRIGGMLPHLPNDVGQEVQGSLARISPPWSGLLPNNNNDSSSSGRDAVLRQQQQQRRRPLPTAAIITADTLTSPSVTPPYPLNQILKTQSKGQVQEMLDGLVRAAAAAAAAAGAAQ